jgi:hypothetical protein
VHRWGPLNCEQTLFSFILNFKFICETLIYVFLKCDFIMISFLTYQRSCVKLKRSHLPMIFTWTT